MNATDPYNLQRFIKAQAPVYPAVLDELSKGRKQTHWMWFIFPQLAGLGKSPMARQYAISSLPEARAYLQHPLLGERLIACTKTVLNHEPCRAEAIFGYPDDLKFRSCMTLFSQLEDNNDSFKLALLTCFNGQADDATLQLLRR